LGCPAAGQQASKFEDGYEVAVKALIDAKVNNLPIQIDEGPSLPPMPRSAEFDPVDATRANCT
jgi:hypothetical protein